MARKRVTKTRAPRPRKVRQVPLTGGTLSARRALEFLSEAGRVLSSSLEFRSTLETTAELAVPALGDWCIAYTLDAEGVLRRVATAHKDSRNVESYWKTAEEGPTEAVRAGHPILRLKGSVYGRHLEGFGIHSWVALPLVARGRTLGVIVTAFSESERRYGKEDLPLLTEFADRVATALDNALLYDALDTERRRLVSVLEHMPIGVILAEAPSGRIVMGNKMVQEILRHPFVSSENIAAYSAGYRGFHPDGGPLAPEEWPLARAVQFGEVIRNQEIAVERGDGTRAQVSNSAAPIRDAEGRITGAVVAFTDVTERVLARQKVEALASQLANQQRWLESLLDLTPVPLILVEPGTGEVTFANRAADELAGGFPRTTLAERPEPYRRATDADGRPVPLEDFPMARAIRGERLIAVPMEWDLPAGRRSVLVSSERLPAMFGHPETVVITYLDVTQLRTVESELQKAIEARDDFLSIAAHELRTPITSLRLYLQTLVRFSRAAGPTLPIEDVIRRTEQADKQVHRLVRLVESLLDFTRIQAGRLELDLEEIDLAKVVRDTAAQLAEEAARVGCEVHLDADAEVTGEWDVLRLEQIVWNLLANALKYGAGAPIHVQVEDAGEVAILSVKDRGIGISEHDRERLFRRFERAVSDRNYGGFGLGLWIVHQIVGALGGRIDVESEEGKGATFTVTLPKKISDRTNAQAAERGG